MKKASSRLALLDVSALVSFAWMNHPFHPHALEFMDRWSGRWATCAITQLGFVRLSANPSAVGAKVSAGEARRLLERITADDEHVYLESLGPPASEEYGRLFDKIFGARMTTDAYLIALAKQSDALFVTFDTRLSTLSECVRVIDPSVVE